MFTLYTEHAHFLESTYYVCTMNETNKEKVFSYYSVGNVLWQVSLHYSVDEALCLWLNEKTQI